MPKVNREHLFEFSFALPELAEQRRIAGILDEAFDGIGSARVKAHRSLETARAVFATGLGLAFARVVPRSDCVSLSRLLSVQPRNGWSPPAEFQTGEGTPVLTLSAVTGFEYDGSRVKLSSVPTREDAHYWLQEGELLITRSNTPELVGHGAIYDGTPERAICCDLIMKMTVDPAKADTRFIYYYLRSAEARSYFTSRAHGASSTMKKISKQMVQEMPVPLPPIAEQHRIAASLDTLLAHTKRLESIYKRKLAALDELKRSLLHQAFTGQLTARALAEAVVLEEAERGNPVMAAARVRLIERLTLLPVTSETRVLARDLLRRGLLPPKAAADALHVAVAALGRADFLVTWNMRHLGGAAVRRRIEDALRAGGLAPPTLCTPLELLPPHLMPGELDA